MLAKHRTEGGWGKGVCVGWAQKWPLLRMQLGGEPDLIHREGIFTRRVGKHHAHAREAEHLFEEGERTFTRRAGNQHAHAREAERLFGKGDSARRCHSERCAADGTVARSEVCTAIL